MNTFLGSLNGLASLYEIFNADDCWSSEQDINVELLNAWMEKGISDEEYETRKAAFHARDEAYHSARIRWNAIKDIDGMLRRLSFVDTFASLENILGA